jgi:hypothetical protein
VAERRAGRGGARHRRWCRPGGNVVRDGRKAMRWWWAGPGPAGGSKGWVGRMVGGRTGPKLKNENKSLRK